MLALQMIRIMDRIWLQEGLDLRIVNFKCISTGKDKGIDQQLLACNLVQFSVTFFKDLSQHLNIYTFLLLIKSLCMCLAQY